MIEAGDTRTKNIVVQLPQFMQDSEEPTALVSAEEERN